MLASRRLFQQLEGFRVRGKNLLHAPDQFRSRLTVVVGILLGWGSVFAAASIWPSIASTSLLARSR